jgi:alpha-L-fucosidase
MDMPLGLYLSPWDRHEPCYLDKEAYDKFYIRQLTELCTKYGELFEIWFDGAGSEGRVYDWESIMAVKEKYQPQAMVFNMGKPTIRWVGNEDGLASDPCYYAVNSTMVSAFAEDKEQFDNMEDKYLPPECDVPIRCNWFWQPDDLHSLKTLEHLMGIYYRSVGYGANLLLNVPPDRRGLLDPNDATRLKEMSAEIRKRFADPFKGKVERQGRDRIIDFEQEIELDHLILKENIANGQKINGYELFLPGSETPFAEGVTVGYKKINAFKKVRSSKVIIKGLSNDAIIDSADAFLTGHEKLPELGSMLDYEEWALKADKA